MTKTVRWIPFFVAVAIGCVVNVIGIWLLDVRLELFYGLQTFNFIWFLQVFIWPIVVGLAVSFVYGLGGKWISMLPPLIVHVIAFYQTEYLIGVPVGAESMPFGWFMFFVILAMESAMFGGVFGEIAIRRIYGRHQPAPGSADLQQQSAQATALDDPAALRKPPLSDDK